MLMLVLVVYVRKGYIFMNKYEFVVVRNEISGSMMDVLMFVWNVLVEGGNEVVKILSVIVVEILICFDYLWF